MTLAIDFDRATTEFNALLEEVWGRPVRGTPRYLWLGPDDSRANTRIVLAIKASVEQFALAYEQARDDALTAYLSGSAINPDDHRTATEFIEERLEDSRGYWLVALERFGEEAFEAAVRALRQGAARA